MLLDMLSAIAFSPINKKDSSLAVTNWIRLIQLVNLQNENRCIHYDYALHFLRISVEPLLLDLDFFALNWYYGTTVLLYSLWLRLLQHCFSISQIWNLRIWKEWYNSSSTSSGIGRSEVYLFSGSESFPSLGQARSRQLRLFIFWLSSLQKVYVQMSFRGDNWESVGTC